jgi:branched-chain amino acid transport system substrate-binding protein
LIRTKSTLAATAAAATVLLLAGCSSDKVKTANTNPTGPALTGSPVVLGVISDDSGPTGSSTDSEAVAKAWSDYVNGHGGLNGHPVKVIVKDTQSSSANALQAAHDFIENDHVVAIADNTFQNSAYEKYVDGAKVPVIGLNTGAASFPYLSDANFFTPTPNVLTVLKGLPKAASLLGTKKFSFLYCAEVAACQQAVPIVKGGAEAAGMTAPYSAGFSAASPNYTAQCLAAKQAGVDVLFAGGSVPTANKRVYDDCAKQGYRPLAAFSVSTISQAVLSDPLIEHLVGVTAVLPWFLNQGEGSALFHTVMDSYLPKATSQPVVAAQWAGLQLFGAAAKNVGAAPTATDIYTGLYALKSETLGGLTVPFTFQSGKPVTSGCLFAYRGDKGKLEALNTGLPLCLTP